MTTKQSNLITGSERQADGRWMATSCQQQLVSVIVPTFNRADLIAESLDSVFAQRYRPIEVIVVDDGSTDETKTVVEQWIDGISDDATFHVRYVAQENRGAQVARNRGLMESRGEFIQFLDSDDVLHPEKLAAQVARFDSDAGLELVWSAAAPFELAPDWNHQPLFGKATDRLLEDHIKLCVLNSICPLYRRSLCCRAGPWRESLRRWQDWLYNLKVILHRPRAAHQAGVYAAFRIHAEGQIGDLDALECGLHAMFEAASEAERLLEQHQVPADRVRHAMASRWLLIVLAAARAGQPELARRAAARGVAYDRSQARRIMHGALCAIGRLPQPAAAACCDLLRAIVRAKRIFRLGMPAQVPVNIGGCQECKQPRIAPGASAASSKTAGVVE